MWGARKRRRKEQDPLKQALDAFTDDNWEQLLSPKDKFKGADLAGADLRKAKLGTKDLRGTNFEGANLEDADLGRTDLRGANLKGANLQYASLTDADLRGANLKGANLWYANIFSASGAIYDEGTIWSHWFFPVSPSADGMTEAEFEAYGNNYDFSQYDHFCKECELMVRESTDVCPGCGADIGNTDHTETEANP